MRGKTHTDKAELDGFDTLAKLALNIRWSWNHATDEVWRQLDPDLWEATHNPWVVLNSASRRQIERMLADGEFRKSVDDLTRRRKRTLAAPAWFQHAHSPSELGTVAYFSMEYMLSEALPIYSGGLGNVAGDQLKAASDLGVPVVGVGLLYQQGYFRQVINKDGWQEALYPYNDPGQLPIAPVRDKGGEWLRVRVSLHGHSLWIRAWQVLVGRVTLYLLDTNDPANYPADRGITSQLYGGGPELRLKQELLLGIGGWRLLRALDIHPEVCHLNEGHAAFAVLERAATFMEESGLPFDAALAATRAGNLFTTHTAVAAGFDRFDPALVARRLGEYAEQRLGISTHDLLALGRRNPNDDSEAFAMAYLAIRGSGAVNGVSRLHETVSKRLFMPLFPRWPESDIPVGHVTNGVHVPTWESTTADKLWTASCDRNRWRGSPENREADIRHASDTEIWTFHTASTKRLIEHVRQRLSADLAGAGAPPASVEQAKGLFNPDALTLGFARRFASYKRPNLLLRDRDRLLRLLSNPERPVQLVIAGKAHPEDYEGQALIHEWIEFVRRPEVRPYAAFISDYDMMLTEYLVHGVDVWINTPKRPWEASGTSGMKVLVNGGINLSELDGWWAEAYSPEVGWALGDGQEHGDDPSVDASEAEQLYDLLEREVIPEFFDRGKDGIPTAWVKRMRASMTQLTPCFSADRAVREYTENYYLPAAAAVRARTADHGALGRQISEWRGNLDEKIGAVSFGAVSVEALGADYHFRVQVRLGDLEPNAVRIQLYADPLLDGPAVRQEMKQADDPSSEPGVFIYDSTVPASLPPEAYTPRLIPHFEGVSVPLEAGQIVWQK